VARKPSRGARRKTHSCATTTPKVRRAIQASEETNLVLAKRHGVNRKTIAKWKARESLSDERMGPKNPRSSLLTLETEAIILAYGWRTRLALDDAHIRLRRLMPKLSRSTLYRCLKRRGLSRVGPTASCPPLTTAALKGPFRFEITASEVALYDPGDVIGLCFALRSSWPLRRSRKTFTRGSRRLRLKTQQRFSSIWSPNSPKRSLRLLQTSIRHSPTGERGSTKTWPRSALILSQSPAASAGSSTPGRPHLTRSPRKSVPEVSKSDSGHSVPSVRRMHE
jgi:hypothetical protein